MRQHAQIISGVQPNENDSFLLRSLWLSLVPLVRPPLCVLSLGTAIYVLFGIVCLPAIQLNASAAVVPVPGSGWVASTKTIPWGTIGPAADAQYSGDGLRVTLCEHGACVHCAFQRLDGEATREGLWLTSTVPDPCNDRFRVTAVTVGRKHGPGSPRSAESVDGGLSRTGEEGPTPLCATGGVSVEGRTVRFTRPGLVEEYSVCTDGVEQDFIVLEKPGGARVPASRLSSSLPRPTDAELRVELAVAGARVEQTAYGAQLVLEQSGRKVAYSRLKVTDASGKKLPARMEAGGKSETRNQKSKMSLVVDDANAVYPVRIDPTFSDANWISLGGIPGPNGPVHASVVDDAGNLYIGGEFTLVGDVVSTNIAMWNGSTWSALGSGLRGVAGVVYALVVSGSNVYAGGSFTNAGGSPAYYIARWNGNAWSALSSGMAGTNGSYLPAVHALAISGGNLYAGGDFTAAGGTPAYYVARWDGTTWSALGSGMSVEPGGAPASVLALAVSGSDVYAGGYFTAAGSSPANYVAKWNGSAWSALGSGMVNVVNALAVSGSDVYAGGNFVAPAIAKWDGTTWSALGSGMNSPVYALAVSGSNVFAGGYFTTAGSSEANYIAKWDGNIWSALGSGTSDAVLALAVSGTNVYAGGNFITAGSAAANYVAKWNSSTWNTLGSGMGGASSGVVSLVVSGSDVYAGGPFILATGGSVATNVAKWNGSTWSALGPGLGGIVGNNPAVYAVTVSGTDLYAGGSFTNAGGIAANSIAKWNGSAWSALGSGIENLNGNPSVPPTVHALTVSGGEVYAGGYFDTAGGTPANCIAKWNGSAWSALGSGLGGETLPTVLALAVSGSNVYAGGFFTTAGGDPATNVAKWDGTAWSAVGPGLGGFCFCPSPSAVYALAVSGSDVYAGGLFALDGIGPTFFVAKWNGTTWSAIGPAFDYFVNALAVSGGDLYAAGGFSMAGGTAANGVAKWDGNTWSALGSGVNGPVSALAVSGSDLYAGGAFTMAGGKLSAYAAKAIIAPFYFITTNGSVGLTNGQFYFTLAGPAGSNAVVFASTNLQTWTPLVTNPLTGGSLNFTDTLATNFTRRFYRALLQP